MSDRELLVAEYHQISRKLTYATVILVCIAGLIFYLTGLQLVGRTATVVGGMFILLAIFTFKIPQITHRYMLKKYQADPDKLAILGQEWQAFYARAMKKP